MGTWANIVLMCSLRLSLAAFVAALVVTVSSPAWSAEPAASAIGGLQWRSLGPAISGGRLGAVAGTNRDPALYYVGGADGGVWKSTNGGTTFAPVFDGQSVLSIGAITIDPNDTQTVWVGTGESNPRNDVTQGDGVYKTTDGGKTWTHVLRLHNALINNVAVDPRDAKRAVVSVLGDPFADDADRGIYRTVDGGKTWSKVLYVDARTGASDLVMDPRNPDVLFAGLWQYRRTGWSTNSSGTTGGLFRSNDGGATWTKLSGHGLPSDQTGRIGLAIAASNPSRIYALIETKTGLLWRSDDGGASWTMVSNDTLVNERPFYYSKIYVDPSNADHVWTESVHMAVSNDGGKHFAITARHVHGDHHAMWLSADGKRIIEGNDGGVVFSQDNGTTWTSQKILPISQLYHIGYSRGLLYHLCAPLQDNGMYCAPSNPLDPSGISSSHWVKVGGGDGTWTTFDPRDERLVWMAAGGQNYAGNLTLLDTRTGESRDVSPYVRDQNVVDPKDLRYRFNWETPIAFDPFDASVVYTAGNVVFVTRDRGANWHAISADLTKNERTHQVVTGGITLDGTGAETSDTILALEPSRAARGEIWVGTDDGRVQLTRDGGKHWSDVTPANIDPDGRFASISPSPRDPRTAFAIYDRHMVGDRTPYVFVTHDFGAQWTSIAHGLSADDEARSILVDPHNPNLVYLGRERSLFASWDGGTTWKSINGNLPAVSIHDIRVQPDTDDILLATHGRGAYILDDAAPLQLLQPGTTDVRLFPIRPAYLWNQFSYFATRVDGDGPANGAIVSYYLPKPAAKNPTADVVDASGHVIRTLTTHEEENKQVPDLSNTVGLNRFSWDLLEQAPTEWTSAPKWNRGNDMSVPVLPGRYTVRVHVDGRTLSQTVEVRQDVRTAFTTAAMRERYEHLKGVAADLSTLDENLNALTTVSTKSHNPALSSQARTLIASVTSSPVNDQDNDFLTDVLRERLQTEFAGLLGSFSAPTDAQKREDIALHRLTRERTSAIAQFLTRVRAAEPGLIDKRL